METLEERIQINMGYRDNCSNEEADAYDRGLEESQRNNKWNNSFYEEINKLRAENVKLKKEIKKLKGK